ncbi:MAG: DUF4339 domain-containing protein [Opitutaceae bacterium]|nr:DUF4339 domain-containing protein [Opitutaceae bacterium]
MEEFYIRKEGDEEARGPFTIEQLSSLVEAEQVDRDTFYYESTTEEWVQISTDEQLITTLFPEKKKLRIKQKEDVVTLNTQKEEDAPILVTDMLAAAEGKTEETSDKRDRSGDVALATNIGILFNAFILLIMAAALLVPSLNDLDTDKMLQGLSNPLFLLGIVDLLLCVILFLQVSIFSIIRLRAAFGLGFFCYLFWAQSNELLIWATIFISAGLFLNTLCRNLTAIFVSSFIGLAGALGFAFLRIL